MYTKSKLEIKPYFYIKSILKTEQRNEILSRHKIISNKLNIVNPKNEKKKKKYNMTQQPQIVSPFNKNSNYNKTLNLISTRT